MPSKNNFAQKELIRKQSKRLPPISTDAALFTSTIFAFLLTASNPETFREPFPTLKTKAQEKAKNSEDFPKFAFEAIKPSIEKNLASSCDKAAHLLAAILFLEKIYKRLNLQDPKHIVTIIYCVIRLAKDQKEFAKFKQGAIKAVGKNWLWPLVWEMALTNEVVTRRWNREEANGRLNLYDWTDDCQKFANNYWRSRRTEFKNIKNQKAKMLSSLRKMLDLTEKKASKTA